MLWWRPERGEPLGYADGWTRDGSAFFFSGTGQFGDQTFDAPLSENARVRDHAANGDSLRLLRYVGRNRVQYVAELRLDDNDPWTWRDGPDRAGLTRKIIQFNFVPIGAAARFGEDSPTASVPRKEDLVDEPRTTDIEALGSETFTRLVSVQRQVARRRERSLIERFVEWVRRAHGFECAALEIPYAPEHRNLRVDLFLSDRHLLIEAKASAARESIRMAIGQVLDYVRFVHPPVRPCVLLPSEPPADMLPLLGELGIGALWEDHSGFQAAPADLLS